MIVFIQRCFIRLSASINALVCTLNPVTRMEISDFQTPCVHKRVFQVK